MRIGYCVEGSTDRALVVGLHRRWCPTAELIEGRYRGAFRRREIPNVCLELINKGADVIVFLRDANEENWRDVKKGDQARGESTRREMLVFGVCDRNVECWLAADPDWFARQTHIDPAALRVDDPKNVVAASLNVTARERQEDRIALLVEQAPLRRWLANSRSFEDFFDQLWEQSKRLGCRVENLREREA